MAPCEVENLSVVGSGGLRWAVHELNFYGDSFSGGLVVGLWWAMDCGLCVDCICGVFVYLCICGVFVVYLCVDCICGVFVAGSGLKLRIFLWWACGGFVGGSGLRGQRSPSAASPITAAANFRKLKKRKGFLEQKL